MAPTGQISATHQPQLELQLFQLPLSIVLLLSRLLYLLVKQLYSTLGFLELLLQSVPAHQSSAVRNTRRFIRRLNYIQVNVVARLNILQLPLSGRQLTSTGVKFFLRQRQLR